MKEADVKLGPQDQPQAYDQRERVHHRIIHSMKTQLASQNAMNAKMAWPLSSARAAVDGRATGSSHVPA